MHDARLQEYESNPHYLKGPAKQRPDTMKLKRGGTGSTASPEGLPEVVPLDLQSPLEIPGWSCFLPIANGRENLNSNSCLRYGRPGSLHGAAAADAVLEESKKGEREEKREEEESQNRRLPATRIFRSFTRSTETSERCRTTRNRPIPKRKRSKRRVNSRRSCRKSVANRAETLCFLQQF